MRTIRMSVLRVICVMALTGCGSPGVPKPLKVLENPKTGERARFYREVPWKVPANYNEAKHMADWTAEKQKASFTKEIALNDDRKSHG